MKRVLLALAALVSGAFGLLWWALGLRVVMAFTFGASAGLLAGFVVCLVLVGLGMDGHAKSGSVKQPSSNRSASTPEVRMFIGDQEIRRRVAPRWN